MEDGETRGRGREGEEGVVEGRIEGEVPLFNNSLTSAGCSATTAWYKCGRSFLFGLFKVPS